MSIVSLSTGDPTVSEDEFHAAAKTAGFTISPGSQDFKDYFLLQNSFDAVVSSVATLPDYIDPRLVPVEIEAGPRRWTKPADVDDPLSAWAHKCILKAKKPKDQRLAGKTFVIKDNVSVGGAKLQVGTSAKLFKRKEHAVSTIDAPVVRRILEAGGTIEGTAVCENLSLYAVSITADSGPVHNAWAPGYATGGSSSGCAALVSAKDVKQWKEEGRQLPFRIDWPLPEGVDMAVGGDQGGSIRLPAHFSGIYGLKPTHGLVPYTGIACLHPMIDSTGPMARSVSDIALLLGVLAGYDGMDYRQTPETPLADAVPDYLGLLDDWKAGREKAGEWTATTAGKGLRIGILKEAWEVTAMDPGMGSAVRAAAERFREIGADVKEVSVPLHLAGPSIWTVSGRAMMPRVLSNAAPDLLGHPLPAFEPSAVDQAFFDYMAHRNPSVINVLLNSAHLESKYGAGMTRKAHMHVLQLRAAYDKALEDVDVLITPVTGGVAIKHPDGVTKEGVTLTALEMAMTQVAATVNTCPFNSSGHPAMSMPIGWLESREKTGKLPIGMQLVAKRWHELDILKAATAWEVLGKGLDAF